MTQQNSQENTDVEQKVAETNRKEDVKPKDNEMLSKMKKKRKSTVPKLHGQNHKQDAQFSNEKQTKLTQMWKNSNTLSQSLSKNNTVTHESLKRKYQQQLQVKNKKMIELRKQRDEVQKKYNLLQNETKGYKVKVKDSFTQALLNLAKTSRTKRAQVIANYGYFKESGFKDSSFVEGPYLKELKNEIREKQNQIEEVKALDFPDKKQKELLKFREKFLQKQLDQLNIKLAERQKVVQQYRERLRFSEKESACYYSRIGWPAIGENERFQTLELLGSGGFGQVYKCYDFANNNYAAIKYNRFAHNGNRSEQARQDFLKHMQREIKIQKNLHHPNIAKLIEIIKSDESEVIFAVEFCEGPELNKYLKKYQCLEQKQAKQIIKQIFCALKYLSELDNKIIHYDLKPANIMFHRGIVKILDFGLCKQMDSDQTRMDLTSPGAGTYWYLPPEAFGDAGTEVSCKLDVWSVGVIFFEMLYGRRPFGHGMPQSKVNGVLLGANKVEFPPQTPMKYKVSEGAKKFISECMNFSHKDRLTPIQAYEHEYLK